MEGVETGRRPMRGFVPTYFGERALQWRETSSWQRERPHESTTTIRSIEATGLRKESRGGGDKDAPGREVGRYRIDATGWGYIF